MKKPQHHWEEYFKKIALVTVALLANKSWRVIKDNRIVSQGYNDFYRRSSMTCCPTVTTAKKKNAIADCACPVPPAKAQ